MRSIAKSTIYISGVDEITTGGLAAERSTPIPPAFGKQVSSGVPGLDGMLGGGGFHHELGIVMSGVAGSGKSSPMAISNLGRPCLEHVPDRCQIEVVDLKKNPQPVREHLTMATPTPVREPTVPTRKIFGALSDEHKVLISLRNE